MADNAILPATGVRVATDEVTFGGELAQMQVVKLARGIDGDASLADPLTDGQLRATPLIVDNQVAVARLVATPTIDTVQYTAGDNVGGLITITGAFRTGIKTGTLRSVVINDKDNQRSPFDVFLFFSAPTTPTNNAAWNPSDADMDACIGYFPVFASDYAAASPTPANAVAYKPNLSIDLVSTNTSFYAVVVARGTPTYTGTSNLVFTFVVAKD